MMKNESIFHHFIKVILVFIFFVISTISGFSQDECGTITNVTEVLRQFSLSTEESSCAYEIKVYPHVINDANGNGGLSLADVQEVVGILNSHFNPFQIVFYWDGTVNDINDNYFYSFGLNDDLREIFDLGGSNNDNMDGIDMYLFPENSSASGGVANGIGGFTANGEQYFPEFAVAGVSVKSSTTSHEMGHVLGLFHTHRGCESGNWELPDGSNCEVAGDMICDTPADPNIGANVDVTTCLWNGTGYWEALCPILPEYGVLPGVLSDYNPDETNIMSYAPRQCRARFSEEQGQAMRDAIKNLPKLNNTLVPSTTTIYDYNTLEVDITDSWTKEEDPFIKIREQVVIKSGATLTIKDGVTVQFAREARLVIEPNATLILEGVLTSACGGSWKGVKVWGEENATTQYVQNGARLQGRLVCRSGSVIENAETGVDLWGGGLISCYQAVFRNNAIGVEIAPFENTYPYSVPAGWLGQVRDYFANFSECSFETNVDFSSAVPFEAFVSMAGVRGIKFKACTFRNTQPNSTKDFLDFGYGIKAVNASFSVKPNCIGFTQPCNGSYFEGLGYGVHAVNMGENRPFSVVQTDFSNCYVGLYNNMITGTTVVENNFELGYTPGSPDLSTVNGFPVQFGAAILGNISGITFQQNNFVDIGDDVSGTTFGVFCQELGGFNNLISGNTFTNLDLGNFADGTNKGITNEIGEAGLHYLCNSNEAVISNDFFVNGIGIREQQGVILPTDIPGVFQYLAAGNKFSYSTFINDSDFSNSNASQLIYHYYPNGSSEPPINHSNIVPLQATEFTCPKEYCLPPCKTPAEVLKLKEQYYSYQSSLADINNIGKPSENEEKDNLTKQEIAGNYYRQEMDKAAYMVVLHMLNDSLFYHPDSLDIWLENLDNFGMDLQLAIKYQLRGDAQKSNKYLNRASERTNLYPQQQKDLALIKDLFAVLDKKSIYNLEKDDLSTLEQIAKQEYSIIGSTARNILSYYGYHYPIHFEFSRLERSIDLDLDAANNLSAKTFTCYPNPSDGVFNFSWNPIDMEDTKAIVSLTDISGKIIGEYIIHSKETLRINLSSVEGGIYFYKLIHDNKILEVGKVVKH